MNAMRSPSGEITGDCIAGSAANADAGGGCAAATGPRHSARTRKGLQLFMAAPHPERDVGNPEGKIAALARYRYATKSLCPCPTGVSCGRSLNSLATACIFRMMYTSTIVLKGKVVVDNVLFSWWVTDDSAPRLTVSHPKHGTETRALEDTEPRVQ